MLAICVALWNLYLAYIGFTVIRAIYKVIRDRPEKYVKQESNTVVINLTI
jgi:hypothetical protein